MNVEKTYKELLDLLDEGWKAKPLYQRIYIRFCQYVIEPIWDIINPVMIMRRLRWGFQFCLRGFSDRDLWSLDYELVTFILPRLKRFQKIKQGVPGSSLPSSLTYQEENFLDDEAKELNFEQCEREWTEIINKMIIAFELILDCQWDSIEDFKDKENKILEGLTLFSKYFRNLWI